MESSIFDQQNPQSAFSQLTVSKLNPSKSPSSRLHPPPTPATCPPPSASSRSSPLTSESPASRGLFHSPLLQNYYFLHVIQLNVWEARWSHYYSFYRWIIAVVLNKSTNSPASSYLTAIKTFYYRVLRALEAFHAALNPNYFSTLFSFEIALSFQLVLIFTSLGRFPLIFNLICCS